MTSSLLAALILAAHPAVEAETITGEIHQGQLTEIRSDQVTIEADGGPVVLATKHLVDLVPVEAPPGPAAEPGVWVDLVDGSTVLGGSFTTAGDRARVLSLEGLPIELPLRAVLAVRLQASTPETGQQWSKLRDTPTDRDLLVVRRAEALDFHRGAIREVTDDAVQFELEGEVLPVKRNKVHGMIYYRARSDDLPEPLCRITVADGSVWLARVIGLDGDDLTWTSLSGAEVRQPLAMVARLDFSQGKIVYLSDLKPESVEWMPYFGQQKNLESLTRFFAPRGDRSLLAGPLQLDGKTYRKGLALHSRTTIVYRLPDRFGHLLAVAGIDDRVRPRGNVRLVIRGDDAVLFETTIDGTQPPQPLEVDLDGVRRLTILVDYGEDMDIADHLDLCDLRVVK